MGIETILINDTFVSESGKYVLKVRVASEGAKLQTTITINNQYISDDSCYLPFPLYDDNFPQPKTDRRKLAALNEDITRLKNSIEIFFKE